MTQPVKALVAKPDCLSLVPETCKERASSHKLSSDLHLYTMYVHSSQQSRTHKNTHKHEEREGEKEGWREQERNIKLNSGVG